MFPNDYFPAYGVIETEAVAAADVWVIPLRPPYLAPPIESASSESVRYCMDFTQLLEASERILSAIIEEVESSELTVESKGPNLMPLAPAGLTMIGVRKGVQVRISGGSSSGGPFGDGRYRMRVTVMTNLGNTRTGEGALWRH
jgi:hypothetical protein